MFKFSELGIKTNENENTKKKIDVDDVLNMEIIVHRFKIENSTKKVGTKFLTLQIEYENNKRVVFTGSKILQEQIEQVPENKFPFKTTIKKNDKRLEFT